MTFGERVKQYREAKGYTQEELAELVGVAKTTITGYERGNRAPDVAKIKKIAAALGVTGDDLLDTGTAPRPAAEISLSGDPENIAAIRTQAKKSKNSAQNMDIHGDLTYEQMCRLSEHNSRERLDAAFAKLDLIGRQKVADFAEKLARDPKRIRDPISPYYRRQSSTEADATSATDSQGAPPEDK
ncbi:MAG: helix-turn-helix transcriptional regulator [Oscillibacter sp.]|nr:helix-turn-helix transcriptional regulator [Oscillibacter sp.]MBD5155760.1 helix-turn-helix transcriptional regulator [Oscillibacter sp.]